MSKAFVKDDAPEIEEDPPEQDEAFGALAGAKNYITKKGFDVLKAEVHQLLNIDRPKVVEVVAWAASNGDRSENADYQYGKRRLREIDRRIRFLQKRIDKAEVVEPHLQKGDRVLFGATVTVLDETESLRVYKIVGIDETDGKSGKVSWISPIGKALLQARVGDAVLLRTPKGEEELEIKKIEFLAID